MERAMGIEPTSEAWEACNITQKHAGLAAFSQFSEHLNWEIMEDGKRPFFWRRRPIGTAELNEFEIYPVRVSAARAKEIGG